jgi:hypothetical protein
MTTTSIHPLAADYVRRLERAARVLPRHQRDELVAEIRDHLDAGITADSSEADVRNLLDDLGPPEDIVAAAQPDAPRTERGIREILALLLLVTGLPMLFLGWLAGAVLLLQSPVWTARQKLLGLLVFPGGYLVTLGAGLFVAATSEGTESEVICPAPVGGSTPALDCVPNPVLPGDSGTSVWGTLFIVVLVVAPLVMAAYLYRAAGDRSAEV